MEYFPWAAYSRWQDPPDTHEVDACETCHKAGEHDYEEEKWAAKCFKCEAIITLRNAN